MFYLLEASLVYAQEGITQGCEYQNLGIISGHLQSDYHTCDINFDHLLFSPL